MSKGGGTSKVAKVSGGRRRLIRAKRALMRITMKIARWKRNQDNPEKSSPKWDKIQQVRKRSRHNKWNTEKLERHAGVLRQIIEQGQKTTV